MGFHFRIRIYWLISLLGVLTLASATQYAGIRADACVTNPVVTTKADGDAGSPRRAIADAGDNTTTLTRGQHGIAGRNLAIKRPGESTLIVRCCNADGAFAMLNASPNSVTPSGGAHIDSPIRILRQVRRPDHTITMIRFDYASGTASRVVVDETDGRVLRDQKYPGRPQSSRQEFREAVSIIGDDSALGSLVAGGAVSEGGFIVDGPSGHPGNDRYIQIRLLSPDRRSLLRVVLVDLTERAVASARGSFE
jgi:hypothetical protein